MSRERVVTTSFARKQNQGEEKEMEMSRNDDNMNNQIKNDSDEVSGPNAAIFDLAEFECPVCFKLPRNVIWNCKDGHVLCNDCFTKLNEEKCPSCRVSLQHKSRNIFMEKALKVQQVICTNDECDEVLQFSKLPNHLKNCKFGKAVCKYQDLGCRWYGFVKDQNNHQNCCKRNYNDMNADQILSVVQNLLEKNKMYQKIINKCYRIQKCTFDREYNDDKYCTRFMIIDSSRDPVNARLKIWIDDTVLKLNARFDIPEQYDAENRFRGMSLKLAIIDDTELYGIPLIEFKAISNSKLKIYSAVRINTQTAEIILTNSSLTLKLCTLHSEGLYY